MIFALPPSQLRLFLKQAERISKLETPRDG
jgi:hypothetical protein